MVDVTYRTLGPWGAGKGANLQPSEVDNNFYSLVQAIVNIQDNPEEPNGIYSITVSGTQMTITLNDGTVLGPYTLPVLTFRWRGEWDAFASYEVLDVFTITHQGIYMVQVTHSGTGEPFDPNKTYDDGTTVTPVFLQLFGAVDASLSALPDVVLTDLADEDFLQWIEAPDPADNRWRNVHLGTMAYQDENSVSITGGYITGLATPSAPLDAATKAYVDAMPAGMTAPSPTLMANIIGYVNPAIPNTLSDVLDATLGPTGSVRGNLLHRAAAGWEALPPGTAGYFLQTHGSGLDVTWEPGGAGVTTLYAGAGITFGGAPITASGTISLAAAGDDTLLANTSGASAAPVPTTLTAYLDSVLGTARGTVLTRTVGGWLTLAPGLVGQYLKTLGAGADLVWDSPAGSGTVTSITAGTGISTGGSPITGTGTVALAAIATASLLANTSGSSAAPVPATATLFFDSVFGSTQGAVLYRNATTWVVLAPGTSGQVLTTGGASANPSWAAIPASAPIANQRLLANISGGTAAASANTLSGILDAILGSSRGMLVYRSATGWVALPAGTSGQVLTTGGTAADPSWAAASGGASITVSDTPPASPSPGDAWFDGVAAQLYIRMDDGTSVQWVPASNQPGPQGPAGTPGTSIPLPVAIASGGTGQTTAAAALAALGGISGNQTITLSGAISGTGMTAITTTLATVPIASGGTNATTAAAALTNLGAVAKAGDTVTGTLTLQTPTALVLRKPSAGDSNNIYGNGNGGQPRWVLSLGDSGAESGSNSGSNFSVARFNDAGTFIDYPFTINRATGDATFSSNLTIGGATATKPGGGPWVAPSDRSLKSGAAPWHTGLAEVLQLEPIIYRYANAAWNLEHTDYVGVDAEDAAAIIPEMGRLVSVPADDVVVVDPHAPPGGVPPGHQTVEVAGVEFGPLVYALVNSVKELAARLEKLEQAGVVQ